MNAYGEVCISHIFSGDADGQDSLLSKTGYIHGPEQVEGGANYLDAIMCCQERHPESKCLPRSCSSY